MTPAVASYTTRIALGSAVLAAAALIGAASLLRGPDLPFEPVMADRPVQMPDGSRLHVQKYEVSVAEWNACHDAGACSIALRAPGNRVAEDTPATGLSYVDVLQYLDWVNDRSDTTYRLPTLAEWETMAAEVLPETPDPIFTDPELRWASAYLMEPQTNRTLRPRGSFDTTSHGIVDLNGSVWEWTMDCYAGAADEQITPDRCPAFFVGGEHITAMAFLVRDPARGGCAVGTPPAHLGMRLVTEEG